jgi:galactoside O-acetyltransferase
MGFKSCGQNVLISEKASFYGMSKISLEDSVRIDDFCILSAGQGGISVGRNVHISCYSSLIGEQKITIHDFAGISSRVSIYSSSDDYTGEAMTNPTIPEEFRKVDNRPVVVGRHCIIGSGSVILPGVTIEEGCAIGALTMVYKDCPAFGIYFGNPARKINERSKKLLELEKTFISKSIKKNKELQ